MLPKSRRFVPPSERPPTAPSKAEIEELIKDHIGGYTKKQILRLIEIHKHFVDFHYEPQNSDGGLIPDDGTDPLYYYQSNLPLVQRLIATQKIRKDDDSDDDANEEDMALDIDERIQELRDGVQNNALVSVEKGKLSKIIAVQKYVAANLQETSLVVDSLQKNKEFFDPDENERVDGKGSLALQIDMLQNLLKFRRDQTNQLKKLTQCLSVKLSDLAAANDELKSSMGSPKGKGSNGPAGSRFRAAANVVRRASSSEGTPSDTTGVEDVVDGAAFRELVAENQSLRKEQEYLYFRLYGNHNRELSSNQPPVQAVGRNNSVLLQSMNSFRGKAGTTAASKPQGPTSPTTRSGSPPNAMATGAIESHPEYGAWMKQKEKQLRAEMETLYQQMAESEATKQFVSATKGADALKKLSAEVENYKFMLQEFHKKTLHIIEIGQNALKSNRTLEARELAWHDSTPFAKNLEKIIAVRAVKDYQDDSSSVGKALDLLHNFELAPKVLSQASTSVEALVSELSRQGSPLAEESLERMCLSVGGALDVVQFLSMKLCGSLFAAISALPSSVVNECSDVVQKIMRVMLPQWMQESLDRFVTSTVNQSDPFMTISAMESAKERNPDLRRLLRLSRGSSRRKSRGAESGTGNDVYLEGEPLPPDCSDVFDDAMSGNGEGTDKSSRMSASARSHKTPTPRPTVSVQNKEVQCDLARETPRGDSADHHDEKFSSTRKKGLGAAKFGSMSNLTTPRSARAPHPQEDAATQTRVTTTKAQGTQVEADGAAAALAVSPLQNRLGSASHRDSVVSSATPSRPVSAMVFANPLLEGAPSNGSVTPLSVNVGAPQTKREIPRRGAIAFAAIGAVEMFWKECPSKMPSLLEAYINVLRELLETFGGVELRCEDDTFFCVFEKELDAMKWAVAAHEQMLHLPYAEEMLNVSAGSAVSHPSALGCPVTLSASTDKCFTVLSPQFPERWLWRGFRLKVGLHCGSIAKSSSSERSEELEIIDVGGPDIALAAKVALLTPAGHTLATGTFIAVAESQLQDSTATDCEDILMEKWDETTALRLASEGSDGGMQASLELEGLYLVTPNDLRCRGHSDKAADSDDEQRETTNLLQHWVASITNDTEEAHHGLLSKLCFIVVEIEADKHHPLYNSILLRSTAEMLLEEACTSVLKYRGETYQRTNNAFVAVFEDSVLGAQFALHFQVTAMQFSNYPPEILVIPSCKETYEESTLTWRGLKVRMAGHVGPPGMILRNRKTEGLEYLGSTAVATNTLSEVAPFGALTCSPALMSELEDFTALLENPVVVTSPSGIVALIPFLLRHREPKVQRALTEAVESVSEGRQLTHGSVYPLGALSLAEGIAKKDNNQEYESGLIAETPSQVSRRSLASRGAPTQGILSITLHSIIGLWEDEEELKRAFEQRLAAAIAANSENNSNVRLPSRHDCTDDILTLAQRIVEYVRSVVTERHKGFPVSSSSSPFMTFLFAFESVVPAFLCALELQEHLTKEVESLVPPHLADRLEKIYSAETGAVVMEGVRTGIVVHSGSVHLVSACGGRLWSYFGPCFVQAAHLSTKFVANGECIVTQVAMQNFLATKGSSYLDGITPSDFLEHNVVKHSLDEHHGSPPTLYGEHKPSTAFSVLPVSQEIRFPYLERSPQQSQPENETEVAADLTPLKRKLLRSKYGFLPLSKLVRKRKEDLRQREVAPSKREADAVKPPFLWNYHLAQQIYRATWRVATKTSRVMGYPLEIDADPASVDGMFRDILQTAGPRFLAYANGDEVDFSEVMEFRAVLDEGCHELFRRVEENLNEMLTALGACMERPQCIHRSMQSAIIIPPSEKDDAALYKPTDPGPGKKVAPPSRPASRERSVTPTTPVAPGSPLMLPSSGAPPSTAMISVGTENPRFMSASQRPSSRQNQRTFTPPTAHATPAPSTHPPSSHAQSPNLGLVLASPQQGVGYRPGMGVDVATLRIRERRIIDLERHVAELQEQVEALRNCHNPVVAALQQAARTGELRELSLLTSSSRAVSREALLPPLPEHTETAAFNETGASMSAKKSLPHSLRHIKPLTLHNAVDKRRLPPMATGAYSTDNPVDDDGIDFSVVPPQPGYSAVQPDTMWSAGEAIDPRGVHHRASSVEIRRHWRKLSPLAPLQGEFATEERSDGFLLSGETVTSLKSLVAPFTKAERTKESSTPNLSHHRGGGKSVTEHQKRPASVTVDIVTTRDPIV